MKIGILTFHRATNYGAVLQAYAMQEYLNSCGHTVKIIDYVPIIMRKYFFLNLSGISFVRKIKRVIAFVIYFPEIVIKIQRRRDFRLFVDKWLNVSEFESLPKELKENYDAIIIGSDQLWNTKLTGGFDDIYWGNFAVNSNVRIIAYAASASENLNETFNDERCYSALKKFNAIGVREDELLRKIENRTKTSIYRVVDPTILAGKKILDKLSKLNSSSKKYLLIYQVNTKANRYVQKLAKKLAIKDNLEIVEIPSGINIFKMIFNKKYKQWTGPEQFVFFFKNAEIVLTTSFHGTAFSLIYNRNFLVISIDKSIDARSNNLLLQVGLSDRLIPVNKKKVEVLEINWEQVNCKLDLLQEESRSFLKKNLS